MTFFEVISNDREDGIQSQFLGVRGTSSVPMDKIVLNMKCWYQYLRFCPAYVHCLQHPSWSEICNSSTHWPTNNQNTILYYGINLLPHIELHFPFVYFDMWNRFLWMETCWVHLSSEGRPWFNETTRSANQTAQNQWMGDQFYIFEWAKHTKKKLTPVVKG